MNTDLKTTATMTATEIDEIQDALIGGGFDDAIVMAEYPKAQTGY